MFSTVRSCHLLRCILLHGRPWSKIWPGPGTESSSLDGRFVSSDTLLASRVSTYSAEVCCDRAVWCEFRGLQLACISVASVAEGFDTSKTVRTGYSLFSSGLNLILYIIYCYLDFLCVVLLHGQSCHDAQHWTALLQVHCVLWSFEWLLISHMAGLIFITEPCAHEFYHNWGCDILCPMLQDIFRMNQKQLEGAVRRMWSDSGGSLCQT